jgi:hypothetical protein
MKKKILKLSLLLCLLIFSYSIIKINFNKKIEIKKNVKLNNEDDDNNNTQNLINNIKYTYNSINGDKIEILAEFGKTNFKNPDEMFLTNVKGEILSADNDKIRLKSDYANFNAKTFETTFIDNVVVKRSDENVIGKKLYVVFDLTDEQKKIGNKDENLLRMTDNIIYNKPGLNIAGDVFEMDLITKDTAFFMHNKSDRISIKKDF